MHGPDALWTTCHFKRHEHLARQGEPPRSIFRIEEGWACRYRTLSAGRRQITALFLPGEYCEAQWLLGDTTTGPIVALTAVRALSIPLADMVGSGGSRNESMMAMLSATLRVLSRQSEWIVSLGRKTAVERLCAFLSDIYERLENAGRLVDQQRCVMPLTQAEMADVVGLTPVHVNRVLQQLRADGLVELHGKQLRIPDPIRLARIGSGRFRVEQNERPVPVPPLSAVR
jgi:CRP-like cAMP-binding protein